MKYLPFCLKIIVKIMMIQIVIIIYLMKKMKMIMNGRLVGVAAMVMMLAGGAAQGQITSAWSSAVSGGWGTAGNWSPSVVPQAGTNVVLGGSGIALANFASLPVGLVLASVVARAYGNALIKPLVSTATIIPTCAIQMTLSSVLVIAFALWQDGNGSNLLVSVRSLGAFVYLVLIGSIAGMFIWYKVLGTFSAKGASMFFLFTPLFGLIIGWSLLDEAMTSLKIMGAALVGGAILLRSGFALKSSSP